MRDIPDFTADDINRAFELVDEVKARFRRHDAQGPMRALGFPNGMPAWAMSTGRQHGPRLASEGPPVIYAAAWMNGVMVGVALALALTTEDIDQRLAPTPPPAPPSP